MSIPNAQIPTAKDSPEQIRQKHITVMLHPEWWPVWPRLPLKNPSLIATAGFSSFDGFGFITTGHDGLVRLYAGRLIYHDVEPTEGRDMTPADVFDAGWRID